VLELITQGIGYGLNAGVSPGPFQTLTVNSALTLGWRKAIVLCAVPILTDAPIIVVVVFVLGSLPTDAIRVLQIAGGLVLLWVAWDLWQSWRKGTTIKGQIDPAIAQTTRRQVLWRGMTMNLVSPGPYLFWGTITGPLLVTALRTSALHGAAFLVAFYGTFIMLIALTVLLFDRLCRLDARLTRGVLLFTMVLLVIFAVTLIRQGLGVA
jgi:threonine/homoserine/homoserine lactone efflux protein